MHLLIWLQYLDLLVKRVNNLGSQALCKFDLLPCRLANFSRHKSITLNVEILLPQEWLGVPISKLTCTIRNHTTSTTQEKTEVEPLSHC
jgi:hypothetical protein